ncbi:hypothetical protein KM043_008576 [Ampulex compressa]|nr:hypothetical protein KM043_008576 [Ampulex compressa]
MDTEERSEEYKGIEERCLSFEKMGIKIRNKGDNSSERMYRIKNEEDGHLTRNDRVEGGRGRRVEELERKGAEEAGEKEGRKGPGDQ